MRASAAWLPLASLAVLSMGFPACQPAGSSKTTAPGTAGACGLTVLYQNNNNGEIEPCG